MLLLDENVEGISLNYHFEHIGSKPLAATTRGVLVLGSGSLNGRWACMFKTLGTNKKIGSNNNS